MLNIIFAFSKGCNYNNKKYIAVRILINNTLAQIKKKKKSDEGKSN